MISDAEVLIARAKDSSGLSNLGPDGWQEGLDHLIDSARADLPPDEGITARLEATIFDRLTSRLLIEDWYANQEMEPPSLLGPLVIHGLPRTATTAIQYLLANGPNFRYQRRWEISSPVPPPAATSDEDDERRLAAHRRATAGGGGSVQHIAETDGPVDDGTVLGLGFHNQELGLPLPTYTKWWREADLSTTYAYHERVLRLLHTGRPPYRWMVKAPYHNFHLDDLAAHYPDALFVMAHRDPGVALPSTCSTVATAMGNALPQHPPEPEVLGAFLLEHLVDGIGRAMDARTAIGEDRFLDVSQQEMGTDPVGVAERIYDFVGLELDPPTRGAMAAWVGANQRGARGAHVYAAEEYGLTVGQIREAFRPYIERFDLAPETG
jgi:Sulfotransferase family